MLALLDLKFINPANDTTIQHLDASCDTDKKVIQPLNALKLDRIHRFLRLWRKLKGWKMWKLDLVIRHPHIGNGVLDEPFLIHLFYFSQLRNRLGKKATVEQICALFGDLNTETRFTRLHEKREEALYQGLFLNRSLINFQDRAFEVARVDVAAPTVEKMSAHHPVILAALGIRETDLVLFKGLTRASDGTQHITDDLTLSNLSFLWRHAWLSKLLKFKAEEWKIVLKIHQEDIPHFSDPKVAWDFVERIDQIKVSGFTPDQINWILAADRSAKAVTKEIDAARALTGLRSELRSIHAKYDPAQYEFLTVTPPSDVDGLTALLTSLLQELNRNERVTQFFLATLRDEVSQERTVAGLPVGFDFPSAIKSAIRIDYDEPAKTLRFAGLMTAVERTRLLTDPSLAAVTGSAAYQEAVEGFFTSPRLALKFFEPVFTAPLANLPAVVDFKNLSDSALALKISYDAEQRLLRVAGILSKGEKAALDALSADVNYRNAVNSLFTQPAIGVFPSERIWLQDADLLFPLHDHVVSANDNLARNLATAAAKALAYLSRTVSENAVVRQLSERLGLTESLSRLLLSHYAVLPDTLLAHFTGTFAGTTGVVDYATLKTTFDGWFWASRAAMMLKEWKVTSAELERMIVLAAAAQLLDIGALPLDDTGALASLDRFSRTSRLLRLRDSLPETEITLLEVLANLNADIPTTISTITDLANSGFPADVERLNEAWLEADVKALAESLDIPDPARYLLAETWERLRRAFCFLDSLNSGADIVKAFAAAAMSDVHAKTLKELLRSKFGAETWLALSAEIQDVLRERKRDALTSYLLTRPRPADAPSGKWEDPNDLYAYYLLDLEMSFCQLTSRLVQGSGSVQLFVQRCFMGLEPAVVVKADGDDGDSAWHWWKWMRKYRVWEANRKVFLWPENWIEPELKKDRSPFFKDLENELLQNDVNQYAVETAFSNYLEKLHGVAQLEIAGFYQEDDGANALIHVFGRTPGAEPHLYYYRRYNYRQWTPWEKVELDIQGDYLIPAVVNKQLFLFSPVLMHTPDLFRMTPPWQLSYLDRLLFEGLLALGSRKGEGFPASLGTWLPFFYNDKKRTFFVLPSLWQTAIDRADTAPGTRKYYPEIKEEFRQWEAYYEAQVQAWLDTFDLSALTPAQRQQLEQSLHQRFPEEAPPAYTDAQMQNLLKRFLMRFFRFYLGTLSLQHFQLRQFHFKNFYHPFLCEFSKLVYNPLKGIPVLMSRETQLTNSGFSFRHSYQPTPWVVEPATENFYPQEVVDFTSDGAYSPYNWELFFHVPLLIANSLSQNQRFEEARDWYHFIFNPIGVESALQGGAPTSKYWITKPFFETTHPQYVQQRIDNILRMVAGDTNVPGFSALAKKDLEDQVFDWRTLSSLRAAPYRPLPHCRLPENGRDEVPG